MITIKEIGKKRDIPVEILYKRLKRYNIESKKKVGNTHYYNNKVEVLIGHTPTRFFPTEIKKLKIIQYHLMFPNQTKKTTADELGISYEYFIKVLKDWEKNDRCITIKSRL